MLRKPYRIHANVADAYHVAWMQPRKVDDTPHQTVKQGRDILLTSLN